MTGPWYPSQTAAQFTDRRTRLTEYAGLVVQNVRAYRAVARRKNDGREEIARCPHAHAKPSTARKCAVSLARRLNREGE